MAQAGKFARYALSNVVEALSATALGMAVGAAAPSTEAALVLGPAVVLVFIVFGGLYTNIDDMPGYLKWRALNQSLHLLHCHIWTCADAIVHCEPRLCNTVAVAASLLGGRTHCPARLCTRMRMLEHLPMRNGSADLRAVLCCAGCPTRATSRRALTRS